MRRFTSKKSEEQIAVTEEVKVPTPIQDEVETDNQEATETQSTVEEKESPDLSEFFKSLTTTIDRIDEMAADIASLKTRLDDEESEDEDEDDVEVFEKDESDDGPSQWAKSGNEVKVESSEKRLNFFTVSIITLLLLILTAICWRSTLPQPPVHMLDVSMPGEMPVNKITEIPLGINGTPGVCVEGADNDILDCAVKNGVLLLKPRSEGKYTFALAIAQPDKVYLGAYTITVTGDLGGETYKKLSEDIIKVVKENLPKEYQGYCKAIGENFRQASLNYSVDTVESLYATVKRLNEGTLGYNDPNTKIDSKAQAAWYEFMNGNAKEGTIGIVQKLISEAASGNSVAEHRALFSAVADGFSKVE